MAAVMLEDQRVYTIIIIIGYAMLSMKMLCCLGDVARNLLSSGQGYPLASHSSDSGTQQSITPSSSKSRLHSKHSRSSGKPNSPHPFSVESMSSGCHPSPIQQQASLMPPE